MSRNAHTRYRTTRITLALGTGIAIVAGGVFLAGNGNNGATAGASAGSSAATSTSQPTAQNVVQTARVSRGS